LSRILSCLLHDLEHTAAAVRKREGIPTRTLRRIPKKEPYNAVPKMKPTMN
jgi:hypothetical protein